MKTIDLHVHTTASDGTMTPSEVVSYARELGLQAIAVTDHDTAAGLAEAMEAGARCGLEVIPGMELSVDYQGHGIHVLGYFLDPASPALLQLLDWVVAERQARNQKMAEAMRADGIPMDLARLEAAHPHAVIGRPHFAQALADLGLAADVADAFRRYLNKDGPYYRRRHYIPMDLAFQTIRAAGGKAVMAHPLQYGYDEAGLLALVQCLTQAGIRGMECRYTGYDAAQVADLERLAARFDLCVTGGSDFHGARKPNRLGQPLVPYRCLEELKAK